MATSTDRVALPRGTIKRFRAYLNAKFVGTPNHKHNAFQQKTRGYGDYLYSQDREKFNVELAEAIERNEFEVGE